MLYINHCIYTIHSLYIIYIILFYKYKLYFISSVWLLITHHNKEGSPPFYDNMDASGGQYAI